MRSTRMQVLAGVAVSVALVATGCGVGTGTGAAGDRVAVGSTGSGQAGATWLSQAAAQTAAVTSQRVMVESRVSTGGGAMAFETRADGSFDAAAGRGQVTLEVQSDSGALAGQLGQIELIIDGDEVYLKSPMNELLGGDEPWVVLRSDQVGELATSGDLSQTASVTLELVERSGAELTELGNEEVRGVSTTHFATRIDISALLDEASPERAEELRETLSEMEADLGQQFADMAPIETEIWVDEQDFIRRVRFTFDSSGLPESLRSADFTSVQTVELYDFNEPIDITVPDPSEVSELDPTAIFGD